VEKELRGEQKEMAVAASLIIGDRLTVPVNCAEGKARAGANGKVA
jgi:hypothetical protein